MKRFKKHLTIVIIGLFIMLLAGCAKKEALSNETANDVYETVSLSPEGLSPQERIADFFVSGDDILFFTFLPKEEAGGEASRFRFYRCDTQKQQTKKLPIALGADEIVLKMLGNFADEILIIAKSENNYFLSCWDKNGSLKSRKDITAELGQTELLRALADMENHLYCMSINRIIVFDEDGNLMQSFETSGMFDSLFLSQSGSVCVREFDGDKTDNYYKINLDRAALEFYAKPVKAEWNAAAIGDVTASKDGDYLQNTPKLLLAVSLEQASARAVIDWQKAGINPELLRGLCELRDNAYLAIDAQSPEGKFLLIKVQRGESKKKIKN